MTTVFPNELTNVPVGLRDIASGEEPELNASTLSDGNTETGIVWTEAEVAGALTFYFTTGKIAELLLPLTVADLRITVNSPTKTELTVQGFAMSSSGAQSAGLSTIETQTVVGGAQTLTYDLIGFLQYYSIQNLLSLQIGLIQAAIPDFMVVEVALDFVGLKSGKVHFGDIIQASDEEEEAGATNPGGRISIRRGKVTLA